MFLCLVLFCQFFDWFFHTSYFTANRFLDLSLKLRMPNASEGKKFMLAPLVLPLFSVVVIGANGKFGQAPVGSFCWIHEETPVFSMLFYYIPVLAVYAYRC